MQRQSAAERLSYGDSVKARLAEMTAQEIAFADGVSTEFVAKALWLSRVYAEAGRSALGDGILESLAPSQLEVVAALDVEPRRQLLRRAAAEGLPVRDLRRLARQQADAAPAKTIGAADDLASARRALELYTGWNDADLGRLIAGPNGQVIRALARAGQALAVRLERGPPSQ